MRSLKNRQRVSAHSPKTKASRQTPRWQRAAANSVLLLLVAGLVAQCCRVHLVPPKVKTVNQLPTTPVRSQGSSSLCWLYAMAATIETDRLAQGDSVAISVDYLARCYIEEQVEKVFYGRGKTPITTRGMLTTALQLMERYGIYPEDSYAHYPSPPFNPLARRATRAVFGAPTLTEAKRRVQRLLTQKLGELPQNIYLLGATYTPKSMAQSLFLKNDYVPITSVAHRPYGKRIALELPDNQYGDSFVNVPMDSLTSLICHALKQRHAVAWEGDISEPWHKFSSEAAVAEWRNDVTPQERQREWETHKTTDDHAMAIVGMAKDDMGHTYFIAKNSWGKEGPLHGFFLLDEDYVKMKTVALCIHRNALPAYVLRASDSPLQ